MTLYPFAPGYLPPSIGTIAPRGQTCLAGQPGERSHALFSIRIVVMVSSVARRGFTGGFDDTRSEVYPMGYQDCNGATDTRVECLRRLVLIVCARALGRVLSTERGAAGARTIEHGSPRTDRQNGLIGAAIGLVFPLLTAPFVTVSGGFQYIAYWALCVLLALPSVSCARSSHPESPTGPWWAYLARPVPDSG